MNDNDVATTPIMATAPDQLPAAMHSMAGAFPDIHDSIVGALGEVMARDGVMEFTLSQIAKGSGVRLTLVKEYLKTARRDGTLHLLGRRTDDGRIRYCAYRHLASSGAPR